MKPLLISKNYQLICICQICHQGSQGIVVTKADLIGDNRIIFIDHWNNTQLQQSAKSRPGIKITLTIRKIIVRQQHLGGLKAMLLKSRFIGLNQSPSGPQRRQPEVDRGHGGALSTQASASLQRSILKRPEPHQALTGAD
jgi:hypothetical protein